MSFAIEVSYGEPIDVELEDRIIQIAKGFSGNLDFKETPNQTDLSRAVSLTFEFHDFESAKSAAEAIRVVGVHIEGPMEYG